MGASFYWQPVKGRHIPVGARSEFKEKFEKLFGSMPATLRRVQLEKLSTAATMWGDQDDNPFQALADALNEHDEITVWAEY